jgi:hypothetical protein
MKPNNSKSARERFNISKLAIQFSWLTLSFWIAVTVAGLLAFSLCRPVELMNPFAQRLVRVASPTGEEKGARR